MIMLRDFFLQTKAGITVRFVKNKPKAVHPYAIEDAIAVGAAFVDGSGYDPEDAEPRKPEEKFGFERTQDVFEACMRLADRSTPDDFTANGIPKVKAVAEEVGYEVDRVEVDKVWRQVLTSRSNMT